ncbi:MAG: pyridoxal-phosphate dependent enzyme [Phycisphaerae bacterium]|nr:pyridoxal-phosphate dependent enzyme [Phycisphaerae bacterium]
MNPEMSMLTLQDVRQAAEYIRGKVIRTPLVEAREISEVLGCTLSLKLENFQLTHAFKARGNLNKIRHLRGCCRNGVITASTGNHGQGLAMAAALSKIPARVVVPECSPQTKREAIVNYGADILVHGSDYHQACEHAHTLAEQEQWTYVHSFDDADIMAGQGTIGLEILEDTPAVDVVLAPIGGGGLVSGLLVALKESRPDVKVIGVQTTAFPSMAESMRQGRVTSVPEGQTIADGVAVRRPGELPFTVIRQYIDDIWLVDEPDIRRAMNMLIKRAKIIPEPAGAVTLAGAMTRQDEIAGKQVAIVVSGGNVDATLLKSEI